MPPASPSPSAFLPLCDSHFGVFMRAFSKSNFLAVAVMVQGFMLVGSNATTLTGSQVASAAYGAGFRSSSLVYAVAISGAESSFVLEATHTNTNGTIDRGLWQINSIHGYNATSLLNSASYNASAAYSISSNGTTWQPWATYYTTGYYNQTAYEGDGNYLSWLSTAISAAYSVDSTVVHASQDAVRCTASSGLKVRDTAGGSQQTQMRNLNDTGVVTASYQTAKINGTGKTSIWWKVRWSDGQEGWSVQDYLSRTGSSSGPPSAPVATAATLLTSSSFQANWGASSGATGYYMDVSTNSSFSSYVFNNYNVGNYIGITVTPLSAGTTYYYRIRAYNGNGTSGNSNTITVTTSGGTPSAPVATAATLLTSSSFQANWGASSGATGYYMDVSTNSSFSSYVFNNYNVGNYIGITVTPLSAGTTYYYRIRAYNGNGTSGNSNTISVTTGTVSITNPTVQTVSATSITSTSAVLGGTIMSDGGASVTTRRFGWGTDPTIHSDAIYDSSISVSGNSFSGTLTGLLPNTTYYYSAWAKNGVNANWGSGQILSFTTGAAASTTINPTSQSVGTSASSYFITITSNTSWSVSESLSWVCVTPASGSGNGSVTVSYDANTSTSQRSGSFTIGGQTHTITQAGAAGSTTISPSSQTVGASASSYGITVTSNTSWSVSESLSWVSVTPASGSGNGSVTVSYNSNTSTSQRSGSLTIGGLTHTITQSGAADTTAPVVNLTYPNSGTFSVGSQITITATASDASGISLCGYYLVKSGSLLGTIYENSFGGGMVSSYMWTVPVTFNGYTINGTDYQIFVCVWDASSNYNQGGAVSSGNLTLQPLDIQAPSLNITSPLNNALFNSASVVVSGNASDNGFGNSGISSVTVNGVIANGGIASGSNIANWSETLTLNSGSNTITVVARDGMNNQTTRQITVTYDAPVIATLLSPACGVSVTFPITFSWLLSDTSAVKVFIATNTMPDKLAISADVFSGGGTLNVDAARWSKIVTYLGAAQTYYWTVGDADFSTFAEWNSFQLTPYALWLTSHFNADQLANPDLSGWGGDANGSGIPNGLKFLLGLNPTAAMSASDSDALPHAGIETSGGLQYLTLTYRKSPQASSVVVNVQTSADLTSNSWQTITPDITELLTPDPVTGDPRVRVKVNATGQQRKFIRLELIGP